MSANTGIERRFICPRCCSAHELLGSKLKFLRGLKQRVCGGCAEAMTRPAL